MEIFLELFRTITANLSRHTTSIIKSSANHSKLLKGLVIKIGSSRHKARVNMLLWEKIWKIPFLKKGFKEATSRVEIIIKPIEDQAAIDIGSDILADFLLITTMISTMGYSIYLRRSRFNLIMSRQTDQENKIISRIEFIEHEISRLLDFKNWIKDEPKD